MPRSGNVAVVFTDLVGSTALATRLGPERAEDLRKEHFTLLRAAVTGAGGTEVKNLGDGLMVVFDSASSALSCAVAMQQDFDARNRSGPDVVRLDIRVGVALGEADEDDGDYFGPPVVEAARLCALAEGGQVLATEVVRLIVGSRGGHSFTSLGERELKGLPDPVGVVEVGWEPLTDVERTGFSVPLPARLTPVTGSVFAGRRRELQQARSVWKSAIEGDRRVVLLAGEAGMGKTTLVSRFAAQVHEDGGVVVYGRCDEELRLPFQPWVEVLTTLVEQLPEDTLTEHVAARSGDLARIVPALTRRTGADPADSDDPEAERYALVSAIADLIARAATLAPLLVVLDDLHWADATTVSVLRHLATRQEPLRLMVVGTYRHTDLAARDPLSEAMAPLHREACVDFVTLSGLDDTELLELMESVAGHEMDGDGLAVRDRIAAETGGNAFFAGEVLRHLAATGGITSRDGRWVLDLDATDALPVSVREVVSQRVARLGPDAEQLLRHAAVIGRDFDLAVLAEAAGVDEDEALDLIEAATANAIVEDLGGDRYTFVHALVATTLYEDLSRARRARAHRRVAEALQARLGDDPGERVVDLARHWAAATVPHDSGRAVEYAEKAGDRSLAQLAPDEALRWYTQALDLCGPDTDPTTAVRLSIGLGTAQRQTGDPAHRDTLLDAARRADDLGATDLLVAAVLANHRGIVSSAFGIDEERVALLEAALAAVGDGRTAERARLLAVLATELSYDTDQDRRRALIDEAVTIAREADEGPTLLTALRGWMAQNDWYTAADRHEMLAVGDEMLSLAERLEDHAGLVHAAASTASTALIFGDRLRYGRVIDLGVRAAERVGQPMLALRMMSVQAVAAVVDGRLDDAEALGGELLALGTDSGQPDALVWYAGLLTAIRFHQGRASEMRALLRDFADGAERGSFFQQVALVGLLLGSIQDEDAELISTDLAAFDPIDGDLGIFRIMGLGAAAHAVARLGDVGQAAPLLDSLGRYRGMIENAVFSNMYVTSTCSGMLADLLGRDAEADECFAEAVELTEDFGAPYHLAFARTEWARVLLQRPSVDPDRVRVLLTDALDAARRHGYGAVERDASELLAGLA